MRQLRQSNQKVFSQQSKALAN